VSSSKRPGSRGNGLHAKPPSPTEQEGILLV